MPAAFARAEDEIAFVSSVNEQRERVDRLLDKGALVPASKLTLAPGQSASVYVVFEPQDSENYSAKLQNKSSKLLIQLLNLPQVQRCLCSMVVTGQMNTPLKPCSTY